MKHPSDVVISTEERVLHSEPSVFKTTNTEVKIDESLKVIGDKKTVEEIGKTFVWLEVSLVRDPSIKGFFPETATRVPSETDTGQAKLDLQPVQLEHFARLAVDSAFAKRSNPGVLLALAYAETGHAWKKSGDTWAGGEFTDFEGEGHRGVGPYQFRPEAWDNIVKMFPAQLEKADRTIAAGQARAAACLEQKFFRKMGRKINTLEAYFAFTFGLDNAEAIEKAEPTQSMQAFLEGLLNNDATAVANELNWRKNLMMDGATVATVSQFRDKTITHLNECLKQAEALIVDSGMRDGGNKPPATPPDSNTETGSTKPTTGGGDPSGGGLTPGGGEEGDTDVDPLLKVKDDFIIMARSLAGFRSPDGLLVEILQAAMRSGGFFNFAVDGEFGPKTEAAVKTFQASRGLLADGKCRARDWELITGLAPPNLFDRCLQLTAAFEGTGFTKAEGNFDGALLTWGIIGFTLAHDLADFLREIESEYVGELEKAFGRERAAELERIIKPGVSHNTREAWVRGISRSKLKLKKEWENGFRKLGEQSVVQELQVRRARDKYWLSKRTIDYAIRWDATEELDVALFYDTSVQNGSLTRTRVADMVRLESRQPNLRGRERRIAWAEIIAKHAIRRWIPDVRKRKNTFAKGTGIVHGSSYRASDWGLDSTAITKEQLQAYKNDTQYTFMPDSFGVIDPPTVDPISGGPVLPWMNTAIDLEGTKEIKGRQHSATIMGWVSGVVDALRIRTLGYTKDEIAWCGLFVAHCMAINGITPVKEPLWALNWRNFGTKLNEPAYGSILVFERKNRRGKVIGGHVGFYISEDDTHFHVLGGNQRDAVNVSKVAKFKWQATVWPSDHMDKKRGGRKFARMNGNHLTTEQMA